MRKMALIVFMVLASAASAQKTVPNQFSSGQTADPASVNENFDHVPPRIEVLDANAPPNKIGDLVSRDALTGQLTVLTSAGYMMGLDARGCIAFAPRHAGRYFDDIGCTSPVYENIGAASIYAYMDAENTLRLGRSDDMTGTLYMLTEEGSCVSAPQQVLAFPVKRRVIVQIADAPQGQTVGLNANLIDNNTACFSGAIAQPLYLAP